MKLSEVVPRINIVPFNRRFVHSAQQARPTSQISHTVFPSVFVKQRQLLRSAKPSTIQKYQDYLEPISSFSLKQQQQSDYQSLITMPTRPTFDPNALRRVQSSFVTNNPKEKQQKEIERELTKNEQKLVKKLQNQEYILKQWSKINGIDIEQQLKFRE
ncbi:Hypothetical_protein [Hexamita inflata]|uniref:Hypothetical_protein n=1 Tax=Hexamita inflata TaxID=28002 RepID=A0ABP1HPC2_9EUKA